MRVLIACEFSGVVRDAFRARGHDAWSCDLLPTEVEGPHLQCDARAAVLLRRWDLLIHHTPCTYAANSGVRWLYHKGGVRVRARWKAMREGADFFRALQSAPVARIAGENPIPHKHALARMGRYTQIIQPWMFGHGETKATCLWLKGLDPLVPTNIVAGRVARVHRMAPSPDRWRERSRTLTGIADAMAAQWGGG